MKDAEPPQEREVRPGPGSAEPASLPGPLQARPASLHLGRLTAEPGSHLGPARVRLSSSPRDWRLRQPGPAPAGCR